MGLKVAAEGRDAGAEGCLLILGKGKHDPRYNFDGQSGPQAIRPPTGSRGCTAPPSLGPIWSRTRNRSDGADRRTDPNQDRSVRDRRRQLVDTAAKARQRARSVSARTLLEGGPMTARENLIWGAVGMTALALAATLGPGCAGKIGRAHV